MTLSVTASPCQLSQRESQGHSSNFNLASSWLSCIGHECRFVKKFVAHWLPALLAKFEFIVHLC